MKCVYHPNITWPSGKADEHATVKCNRMASPFRRMAPITICHGCHLPETTAPAQGWQAHNLGLALAALF